MDLPDPVSSDTLDGGSAAAIKGSLCLHLSEVPTAQGATGVEPALPVTEARQEGVFQGKPDLTQAPQDPVLAGGTPITSPEPIWSSLSFS